jgi:putrescine aminotransferase
MTAESLASVAGLYRRHLASGRAALASMLGGVVEVASEGAWVIDAEGERYLDFGGYAVFILGHRHPAVVEAVHAQLDRHPLATRVFLEPVAAHAAAALSAVTPPGLERVHFVNSGAEAVEAAVKLARAHGRDHLVSADRGYHGKTMGALSITANPDYQDAFRPLLAGVATVPFGDVGALRDQVAAHPGRACVVLEPVQGEGGVRIAPPGYLSAAKRVCHDHGAILVVDEIQTGLGRLGRWFGVDAEGVVPDMLLVGKGLSGGVVPVAALVTTDEWYAPFSNDPYLHSSTFAASPLACAAALAAVRTMQDECIPARAAALGRVLLDIVLDASRPYPQLVTHVRGRGLLIGIQCAAAGLVGEVVLELIDRGVLVNHSLNAARVLRLTPPAILSEHEIDLFRTALNDSLRAVAERLGCDHMIQSDTEEPLCVTCP